MRHAKALTLLAGALGLVATLIACSSVDSESLSSGRNKTAGDDGPSSGSSASGSGGSSGANATKAPEVGSPAATGVVVAHSAFFPSFRLCFHNYPAMLPQPDSKVMPAANVVGVEIGSAVRIDALPSAPGQVYVIDEVTIRSQSGADDAAPCGELIKDMGGSTQRSLTRNKAYYLATELTEPLGVRNVDVLAISGCGDRATVDDLDGVLSGKAVTTSCGTPWDGTTGNLKANVITLTPSAPGPSDTDIPVQLFNLAPAVEALKSSAKVKFGPQTGDGETVILEPAAAVRVKVDQTQEASYGRFAFEVTATLDAKSVVTKQTLADVQQLSSPGDVPTTYYRAASNYALLMLGDPSHQEQRDGAPNPAYNPRRALHILAVPVLDPSKLPDGGADAAPDAP